MINPVALMGASALALGASLTLSSAQAQSSGTALPEISVRARTAAPSSPSGDRLRAGGSNAAPGVIAAAPAPAPPPPAPAPATPAVGSLTVPSVAEQRRQLYQTVGSVAFIDSREFENRYTNNIPDVLRDTPGVLAQTRYGQEIRLSIRGSGLARGFHTRGIEILQDGIPFNLADGSGDFYQIDPLSLRSVEVYRGGNGLIFGSSTLGGAVNFVTPTAYTAIGSNIVRVEGGSFGAARANVQASRIDGPIDALINATYSAQDGYRQHQNQDYKQVNANIGYQVAPGIETRTYLGVYATLQKLPGTLDLFNALTFPRRASLDAVRGNQARDVWSERVANRTSFALDVGKLDLDTWLIHKRLFHPIFQVIDQDGKTYGVSPHWSGSFAVAGYRNDLTVGARVFAGDNSARQFINAAGQPTTLTASARQRAQNYEGYIDNKLWLTPELAFMTGAKLYRDERDFRNLFTRPQQAANRDYDGFNPKVGFLYQPLPTVQIFTDLTKSRDVPDFTDLAQANLGGLTFVPLQQQSAWTAEIGSRGSYDRFAWDITFYRSSLRDELVSFSTNAGLGIPAATFSADRTLHHGLEFAGTMDLVRDVSGPNAGDRLTVTQIWTYNDFRFVRDRVYGNNLLPVAPRDVFRTVLTYRRPDGFFIAPTLDWVPLGAFADYANTLRTPGYALIGLQAGMTVPGTGLSLYLDARNLTDRRYIADLSAVTNAQLVPSSIFYPGQGRSVFAGLRYVY